MSLRGVFFNSSSFTSPFSFFISQLSDSGILGPEKTPQGLEKEADAILRQNGYTKTGQLKKRGEKASEAFKQLRFERSMIPTGFRGASRKNR